jgi:3-oxoacyl-[acyl-carrier-protein] synthase-1
MSDEICNPSSVNRRGTNIGEGAALFLMSREGGNVRLSGAGETSDAHHISAPDPEGYGAYRSMARALEQASRSVTDIDYINLHGTATVHNDAMESKAINNLLGQGVLCSSTKPQTGHCLGASGAIEAGLCWLLLQSDNKRLPIHRWDGQRDENLSRINLTESGNCELSSLTCILSNSFAFGGSNISLLLERDVMDDQES